MPKSTFTSKANISLAAIIIAIAGIVADSFAYRRSYVFNLIKSIASSIQFNWVLDRHAINHEDNYINLFFYVMLLTGGGLYYASNQKETRLVRFGFSVVFCNKLVLTAFAILNYGLTYQLYSRDESVLARLCYFSLFLSFQFGVMWLSYIILRFLRNTKEPGTELIGYGENIVLSYHYPKKRERLFHFVIDNLIIILLYTTLYDRLENFSMYPRGEGILWFLVKYAFNPFFSYVVLRFSYYFIFERTFGSTPGKMLAENLVVTEDGEKPDTSHILKRTFSRFIPFDTFSFLTGNNWHDNLTYTTVMAEKPSGIKGDRYFAIIPITMAVVAIYYFGTNFYSAYRDDRFKQENVKYKTLEINDQLSHLSDQNYLELTDKNQYQPYGNFYLKVQSVSNDEVTLVEINLQKEISETVIDAGNYYLAHKDSLKQIKLTKKQLYEAMIVDEYADDNSSVIKINGLSMVIKTIYTRGQPAIGLSNSDGYGSSYVSMGLVNNGWRGRLTNIEVIDGGITFKDSTPIELAAATQRGLQNSIRLEGSVNGSNNDFKVNITVTDSVGNNKQVYQLTGNTGNSKNRGMRKL